MNKLIVQKYKHIDSVYYHSLKLQLLINRWF